MGVAGISEIFIVFAFIFGGSMGLPLGMPPGPEDPMMFKIVPDDCVFYATWTGLAELDENANPTEAWMAQPKIQAMITKLRAAYRGSIETKTGHLSDPAVSALANLSLELADVAITHPAAVYVSDFKIVDESPIGTGAAIIGLGDETDRIETALEKFEIEIAKLDQDKFGIEKIEVDGQPAFRIDLPETETDIYLALRGKYFVIGFGKESLTQVAINSKTDPPQWLTDFRTELAVERFSSMSYVNTERAAEILPVEMDRELRMFRKISDSLIGDDVQALAWVSGLDEHGFLNRASIRTTKKLTGILSSINGDPIPKEWLQEIPTDSIFAFATRLSAKEILRMVTEIAQRSDSEEELEETLGQFQQITGLSLEEEFIESLGNYVYFYYKYNAANPVNGWLGSIRIEDEMSFPAIFETMNDGIQRMLKNEGGAEFKTETIDNQQFYTIGDKSWAKVTWGLIENQWYFGYHPADIAKHLQGHEAKIRLSNQATIDQFYRFGDQQGFGGPIAVAHLNLKSLLEIIWPFIGMIGDLERPIEPDFDFSLSDIPGLDVLTKELQPNLSAVYRTPNGFQFLQRQTYPGASPMVTMSAIGALATPFAAVEYESAQMSKTQNNGKQLALAFHNFADAYGKFPAAYTTDEDGKPLLSWRVHLLPFLEESELYDQFHWDEPWDSEHNKQLIDKMPDVFMHPTLELPKGKTVFLAVTGDDAMFTSPENSGGEKRTGKHHFRHVFDGTSNTAMMIEVNAANAVNWTQPSDISTDGKAALGKTKGIRAGDQFLLILGDGSVQMVSPMDAESLGNILKINDGHVVELP